MWASKVVPARKQLPRLFARLPDRSKNVGTLSLIPAILIVKYGNDK